MSKFFKALQQAEQERALRSESESNLAHVGAGNGHLGEGTSDTVTETEQPPLGTTADGISGRIEGVEEHLVSLLRPSSFAAEQYRALSHVLERLHETGSVKVVGIASPSAGDGKSVTAINLAGALAQDVRSRVLLLEADLRQPMVARYLGLTDSEGGLTQMLAHPELRLEHAVRSLSGVHLDVLTAGHQSTSPYEVLRSRRAEEVFQEARRIYDYVVVDTPPLVGVPEAPVIEKLVDGLLIVVRALRTSRSLLDEGLRLTDPAKVLGLVFNGDDRLAPEVDGYYRSWGRGSIQNGHGSH